jgi:hypothetical protein
MSRKKLKKIKEGTIPSPIAGDLFRSDYGQGGAPCLKR